MNVNGNGQVFSINQFDFGKFEVTTIAKNGTYRSTNSGKKCFLDILSQLRLKWFEKRAVLSKIVDFESEVARFETQKAYTNGEDIQVVIVKRIG